MTAPFRGHVTGVGKPKRQYESRQQAVASLRKHGRTGEIYQCDLCLLWHVSSQRVKDYLPRDDVP
ncbi:MAG: hypothetical protein M3Z84_00695 [Actinomycetota bacterium]|nr:hypothetical protein [Actinomycetota bacterium]